jgi:valyl-tRNA synthetase
MDLDYVLEEAERAESDTDQTIARIRSCRKELGMEPDAELEAAFVKVAVAASAVLRRVEDEVEKEERARKG